MSGVEEVGAAILIVKEGAEAAKAVIEAVSAAKDLYNKFNGKKEEHAQIGKILDAVQNMGREIIAEMHLIDLNNHISEVRAASEYWYYKVVPTIQQFGLTETSVQNDTVKVVREKVEDVMFDMIRVVEWFLVTPSPQVATLNTLMLTNQMCINYTVASEAFASAGAGDRAPALSNVIRRTERAVECMNRWYELYPKYRSETMKLEMIYKKSHSGPPLPTFVYNITADRGDAVMPLLQSKTSKDPYFMGIKPFTAENVVAAKITDFQYKYWVQGVIGFAETQQAAKHTLDRFRWYHVLNVSANLCLDASSSSGALVLKSKNNSDSQQWQFHLTSVTEQSIRHYKVRCKSWGPGKALDVYSTDKTLVHLAGSREFLWSRLGL